MICLSVGCSQATAPAGERSAIDYVWVEQNFHNGDNGNFDGPVPPSTAGLLEEAGIVPQRVFVQEMAKCMGPGCPTYSGRHFALIDSRDLARAVELGFKISDGPSS